MALGAFLTDRTPLTPALVRRRVMGGAPIYGTSPDRPIDAPRRRPFMSLSPEAYAAMASMVPAVRMLGPSAIGRQAGAAGPPVHDTGPIYQQAQMMLAAWRKGGGPCDPPDFGETTADFTGDANPRTESAIVSFQRWANATGNAGLRDDGVLDDVTLGQLVIVTADVLQKQAEAPKSWLTGKVGWGLLAGGAILALAYSEYSGSTRAVARSR